MAIAALAWLPAMAGSGEAVWAAGLALLAAAWMAVKSGGEWREVPWWSWVVGWLIVLGPPVVWAATGWMEPAWPKRLDPQDPALSGVVASLPLWLESWGLGVMAVLWVWILAALPLDRSLRRSGLRWMAGVGLGVVFLGIVDMRISDHLVPWWDFAQGGPFANKNQFGLVTALTAVGCAALAWEDGVRGRAGTVGWAVGMLLAIGALVLIGSRGAFAGCLVGLCAVGAARWSRRPGALGPVVGFASVVAVFGVSVIALAYRPLARWLDADGWSADARWSLFRDVWAMIGEQPWTGVGLAGFRLIYPAYRENLEVAAPVIHPESDLLWWLAENGWPLVALVALLFVVGLWSERRRGDVLLLSAAWGAAAVAITHGTVDVGLHRPGSFLPVLTLIGLWIGQLRGGERMAYPGPFRAVAVGGGVVFSGWLILAGLGLVPGQRSLAGATKDAGSDALDRETALARGQAGLRWNPLDPVLNFRVGWLLGMGAEQEGKLSQLHLERARRWAPHDPAISFESGRLWLERDPAWAFDAWAETLGRAQGNAVDEWFGRMEAATRGRPALREGLYFRLKETPGLDYLRLERAGPKELDALLDKLLAEGAPPWEGRPIAQQRLAAAWVGQEGGARVAGALRTARGLEDLLWPHVALEWSKTDPRAAAAYALEMLEFRQGPLATPSLEEVRSDRARWRSNPEASDAAVRAASAEQAAGNPEGALDILARIGPWGEAARVRAAALLDLERGEEAWLAIRPLVESPNGQ